MADRNEMCRCGSGLKYKRCCAGKDQKKSQLPVGLLILVGGILLIAAIGFAPGMFNRDAETAQATTPVTAPAATGINPVPAAQPAGTQPGMAAAASTTPAPTQPAVAPPGKVWSAEHGHWHDAATPAANSAIKIQADRLPGNLVATAGEQPGRGNPPEPGATWSEAHNHWHKAGTNVAVGGTTAQGVNPATGAPIGADPAPQSPTQVRAFGELVDLAPRPGTPAPGPAPEGMEWSVEHGHWHTKQQ